MESTLTMSRLEQELTQAELQRLSPIRQPHNVRFYQLLTALNQAVTADPKSTQARGKLAYWYYQAELWDMALEHYEALLLLLEDEEEIAKANEAIVRLTDRVERVRAGLEERRLDQELSDEDHSPFELSRIAGEAGCPKMALELAESQSYGFFDPTVQLVLAKVYTEIGQPESALRMLTPVTASGSQPDAAFDELLGTVLLLQGDYSKASSRWQASIEAQRREAVNAYLVSLRRVLVQGEPLPFFEQAEKAAQQPLRTASGLLHLGMLLMEAGQVEQAAERFREVLEVEPEAPFRILAAFYLNRLTNDDVDSYRPSDYIPMVFAESTESP
jgi:tetratricopeptide (TPR) repeat protein